MEARGFTYAAENPAGRRIRLGYLQIRARDLLLLLATALLLVALFWTGTHYPLHRLGV